MADRPHILLFVSDQHNPRLLGTGDDPYVRTPALDRLAAEGVSLANAYTGCPLCVPARMSLMSGRRCHEIECWTNGDSLDSNVATFAHGLGRTGYRTVLAGRMHFVGGDQMHGFQERPIGDVCSAFTGINRAEDRFRGYYGNDCLLTGGPGRTVDQEYDTAVAMTACRVLRDHEVSGDARPLCLVVGFYLPHDPYRCYDEYYAPYAETADLPFDPEGETLHPLLAKRRDDVRAMGMEEEHVRRARAAYRGRVSYLDMLIGRILECLEESPLGENALRIYTSDHGDMLGEHGLWAKGTFYDPSARVPLLMSWPGVLPKGEERGGVIELCGLGPTLLAMTEADPLPGTDGRSFETLLAGGDADGERIAYSEHLMPCGPSRMVRRGPWKLNHYPGEAPELFHMEEDPREAHNRAEDPACADVRRELEGLVEADGWSPERIRARRERLRDDAAYVAQWGTALYPAHPVQWGLPAQL